MKIPSIPTLSLTLLLIFSCASAASADAHEDFLTCLSHESMNNTYFANDVHSTASSSFDSVLQFSIRNLRFASESTPKPQVIITPEHESQIPPVIYCAKQYGVEIRVRSGGHDLEGLSYVSQNQFVIIDLINMSEINIDVEEKTAWVQSGATLGTLYYRIAEKSSTLAYPAGLCPTVGVGGQFSGGGEGTLLRKYGLAADNVIDARIIDVNGKIMDRKSMGEDLFWAIRGGGGASFGVIVAWKVQLVDVPEKVTVFTVNRALEQNATQLIQRWQEVAPKLDRDLFIGIFFFGLTAAQTGANPTILASFFSLFLGEVDRLLPILEERFPELGVRKEDCLEMSWIESTVYFATAPIIPPPAPLPLEFLLNRTQPGLRLLKMKSDYAVKPISAEALEGLYTQFYEHEAAESFELMLPYGGRMTEISESAIPFPHRSAYIFKVALTVAWKESLAHDSEKYISWSRRYHSYMTPYVSKNPRATYYNNRDLDIGVNNVDGNTSYTQASAWGVKYFGDNFDRLVRVKSVVDPHNFFKNEQSIPPCSKKED
ncbi:tetrahydrocannabinolic acid synthase-like [Salvia splendens]|uniref:tetrahydrocannabinolic acid synthase-like n=1 Tax=Salvia splendens TaxID=180675 RepID=UPI0010FFD9F3|nr:tetrahydrocannabinolic acid synthase-like [Salvia splendens]